MAKHANEIIGFHLGWDIRDVSEGRYQRYRSPAVYVCANDYYCCPTSTQQPPKDFTWVAVGTYYGRTVYRARSE